MPSESRAGGWVFLVSAIGMLLFAAFFAYRHEWPAAVGNIAAGFAIGGYAIWRILRGSNNRV